MSRTRALGAYQPRTRRGVFADRIEDFRRRVENFVAAVLYRGSGLLLLLGALAGLVALGSYNPADSSLNNAAGGEPVNWLQGPGATAADLLLQLIGLAAYGALGVPLIWGAMALGGRGLRHANWRAIAWPAGTLVLAGGLGGLPSPLVLPAGSGGLVGLAVFGLLRHGAQGEGLHWLLYAVPALFVL